MQQSVWILFMSGLLGCAVTAPAERAEDRGELPRAARPLLTDRMYAHGEDVRDLNWAVLFLDRATVQEIAERISEAPRFAPPMSEDASDLNAQIPADFFALQTELKERAQGLSTAAASRDLVEVSSAYGLLVQTCVRCHDRYLEEPPIRELAEEER